jgi:hypothetical protein
MPLPSSPAPFPTVEAWVENAALRWYEDPDEGWPRRPPNALSTEALYPRKIIPSDLRTDRR